jgi:hypothetical protein
MWQQQLDYASPPRVRTREQIHNGRVAIGALVAGWFAANLVVVVSAASGLDGFQAMGVAVFGAIAVNAALLVVGLASIGRVSRAAGREALALYVLAATLLTLAASIGDFFVAGYLHRQ